MSRNVSEFVWRRLSEWGLKRVYGYPGDGVGGLDVALEKAKDFMEYVQVRHEEMAAFMASAYAKFTGELGVCYATSGPGAIICSPAFTTRSSTTCRCSPSPASRRAPRSAASYQQEVDLQNMFKDVASEFVGMASVPEQVRHLVDRAMRIAHGERASPRHLAQRPAGIALRGSAARARHDAFRHRLCGPAKLPDQASLHARGRSAQQRQEGRDAGRGGRARRDRRGDRSRRRWAPASPRRCSARRRCLTICPG